MRRLFKVGIGDLQIVLLRHGPAVADPLANDVQRIALGKLRLPAGAQIVKQLRPRLQSGLADDPVKLRPQVAVCLPVSGDDEFRARLGFGEHVQQRLAKLWKHRNDSAVAAFMVFGFR
ncbi:MAG: hypothetical protein ABSB74_05495 [Tepidisphaeraceae bacterium]